MKTYDYLIIGNGIAGVTAAETIREHDASGTIAIVSHEPHVLYSRVLLPAYLKKRIPREKVFLRTQEDFNIRRIDCYLNEAVVFADTARKQIDCESGFSLGYNKLLIASGGRVRDWEHCNGQGIYPVRTPPTLPEVKKADGEYNATISRSRSARSNGVYRLQTLDDADVILRLLPHLQSPLVIGASFIGLEFLEILTLNNTPPKVVVRDTHFLRRLLDRAGGEMLQARFEMKGISVECQQEIVRVFLEEGKVHIKTSLERDFSSDAVFLGIGIQRNMEFLAGSGVAINGGGVETDEYLRTNVENVFAAGDAADYMDVIAKKRRMVGNWTHAFLQGKAVGRTMAGKPELFKSVPAYSITNFGFQITAVGETDDALETFVQFDEERNRYARFFIKEDHIAGAALINKFTDKPHVARLIETQSSVRDFRAELRDPLFDIQKIPIVE
ncbi:MAG: FAD-dependent oxidoreductase [Candidatus Sungbacteria bacterium]|nr:FAD-dependent oxidoreductase [Candidatus Sungbacteria bacterium]